MNFLIIALLIILGLFCLFKIIKILFKTDNDVIAECIHDLTKDLSKSGEDIFAKKITKVQMEIKNKSEVDFELWVELAGNSISKTCLKKFRDCDPKKSVLVEVISESLPIFEKTKIAAYNNGNFTFFEKFTGYECDCLKILQNISKNTDPINTKRIIDQRVTEALNYL